MSRRLVSTGSPFEKLAGYSRAVVEGDMCFVAGTTGYDYATMTMPESVAAQAGNALATIERTLVEAGFSRADIVRATYYVTDMADAEGLLSVFGDFFGEVRPASTLIGVAALYRPEMRIEIEVTAKRRS